MTCNDNCIDSPHFHYCQCDDPVYTRLTQALATPALTFAEEVLHGIEPSPAPLRKWGNEGEDTCHECEPAAEDVSEYNANPDVDAAMRYMSQAWRRGQLGRCLITSTPPMPPPSWG